jgi:S-DNA-T family DNA segregation ATPase FtsK/SpoIIIE
MNHAILDNARTFVARRAAETAGLTMIAATAVCALSLASWSTRDPSFNHATSGPVRNLLGAKGAIVADLVTQTIGIAGIVLLVPLALWGWRLLRRREIDRLRWRLGLWLVATLCAAGVASLLPATDRWPLPTGLGGMIGDAIASLAHWPSRSSIATLILVVVLVGGGLLSFAGAVGGAGATAPVVFAERKASKSARRHEAEDTDDAGEPGFGLVSLGAFIHAALMVRGAIARRLTRVPGLIHRVDESASAVDATPVRSGERHEPTFAPFDMARPMPAALIREPASDVPSRVAPPTAPIRSGKREARERQPSLLDREHFALPPLSLLVEPRRAPTKISQDSLEQNARLLEGVLEDFGVKGEIIGVRPGPVVTLYELEPAPGIKSSRVIGLADDIARSMSAISARVAVVQGRNAIGIELPNQSRETVFLRELVASADFESSKHRLVIALGKTIGGEPVIVDLARMPHLLVAGTTGSGKSVAINTMILSLLYRLRPDECRLIMIDPKMLELSVYDGIPHLLTPVVTDPKKAVVALKWAVREMDDRYRKMSKIGVRNIDGFNAKVAEATASGKTIKRTVQTGFDRETGEAVYEQEEMELTTLPFIVVIVDEMADLMMVAGKDIEGAIQRLAQMARAAGIHLIMATQRPSVDVITGTIKANFPTRISFQVTSKIDSRTILGEQGAEQLLGQGDMLYMAGGGRISRVHGPFVSDTEVEKIVAHLKTQGVPDYLDAITVDEDDEDEGGGGEGPAGGEFGDESADLYDRAVAIVLRDRKCSTSYIQRRLSVGYNKAASLVERMEKEGVIGQANHAGKREILVPEREERIGGIG